jgi:iron(III) transport system permease protein
MAVDVIPRAAAERPGEFPAPRYRRPFGVPRELWLQYLALGLVALLVLAPVLPTLYQSVLDRPLYEAGGVFTLDNYVNLFKENGFGQVALNTVYFASLTTVFALGLAVPMAIIVVRTNLPAVRVVASALHWPFFISSLILAFGWITMYGPAGFVSVEFRKLFGFVPWNLYSIPGMAITEAVALAPIAFVFCANALRLTDASLESAAQVCGAGPFRILRSVVFPLLRPPVLYSALLVVSIALETLSVPLLYGRSRGIEVFSSFLYTHGLHSVDPNYGILGAASVIILITTIGLVAVQARLLKNAQRFVSVRGKATRPRPLDLGRLRWVALAFVSLYLILGALIPIGGLVFRSFTLIFTPLQSPLQSLTLANYDTIFTHSQYVQSIYNSLIIATVGAVLVSTVAVVAVMVSRRSSFRFGRTVEYLALLPQAMPGIIVGIGFFWAFAYSPFGLGALIQGTLWAVMLGFGIRALPSAFGSISPVVLSISQELDNAARVSGLDWARSIVRVLWRLVVPAFFGAVILCFVTMMKEYTPAVFLATADTNVIGSTSLELWVQGNTGSVAALATIQIAITSIGVAIAGRFMKGHTNNA